MNFKKVILITIIVCMLIVAFAGCKHGGHVHETTATDVQETTYYESTEALETTDAATETTEEPVENTVQDTQEMPTETETNENNAPSVNEDGLVSLGRFMLTAYCPCSACCGQFAGGTTASGVMPTAKHTIAVDPSVIPYGTEVVINGNTYVAEDTGGAIVNNRIDIYFDTHQEALNFGVQYAEVFVKAN